MVVNHHLFFADLALRDEGFGEVLPGVNAFIFDEAHQLPDVASTFFGSNLSARQLTELGRDVQIEVHAEAPDVDSVEASITKLDRICQKLQLNEHDRILEIGTGWGGLAIHAACNYGCRVTTTTISPAQFTLAQERVQAAGLADRIEVLLEDYRHLRGSYDKLVSIEMIEAVGFEYLDDFFRVCSERLKEDGLMCLQAITIADQVFDRIKPLSGMRPKLVPHELHKGKEILTWLTGLQD